MAGDLSIVALIPALQAEKTLAPVIEEARKFLPVVVVDDGSTDRTSEVARAAGAVAVLRHEKNRGKGAALKTGFAWALERGARAILTLDADGQHRASEIPRFLEAERSSDAVMIIGSRRHLFPQMLARRRVANLFSAWSISIAAQTLVDDSQSGFRLYRADLLRQIPIEAEGFDAESEIIVRAGRLGLPIQLIPIELGFVNGVVTSHYKPVGDTLRIAWRVVKTAFERSRTR